VRVKELLGRFVRPTPALPFSIKRIKNEEEFRSYREQLKEKAAARQIEEDHLAQPSSASFATPGFCFVCGTESDFVSSWQWSHEVHGKLKVNWREHLRCPHCRLNNRMRASIHLLMETIGPTKKSRIYATEQATPLFRYLRKHFPLLVGSEFLQTGALHQPKYAELRHEDLTRLSFPSESFDVVLSFDVLEHIPNYERAFAECARTLKPEGKMLFSVPFDVNSSANQIRAKVQPNGNIEHLQPPEYHCDPRNPEGCLSFQRFGWEMLEQMKAAGFSEASALSYYSREYGYLGGEQMQFLAEK
jgi:SAM-dependent methyltransferase